MGHQGTMRHTKGARFFNLLAPEMRERYIFKAAYCWRDNDHVWLQLEDKESGEVRKVRIRRTTGMVCPLRGMLQ